MQIVWAQCGTVSTRDLHNKMRCKGEAGDTISSILELLHVLLIAYTGDHSTLTMSSQCCWIGNGSAISECSGKVIAMSYLF